MTDKIRRNRAANMEKAEGSRWRSNPNAVAASGSGSRNVEDILGRDARGRHSTPRRYDEDAEPARRTNDRK
jgi:hypothetical protein